MLNSLNPKLFETSAQKETTRKGFGEGLLSAGEKNGDIVTLTADLAESTFVHLFREKFPKRFFDVGVAEQNMASIASGMSAMGKIPVIASYAIFSPGRNWEQIRTTISYNDRPVVIVGSHAGLSVGADGGSHQALEDIALMRVMPNMIVISPCDAVEAKKAITLAVEAHKPVYLRLCRDKTPIITTEETPFEIGKSQLFFPQGRPVEKKADVGIIATGPIIYKALKVAEKLKSKISIKVLNMATIKPLDEKAVLDLAKETEAIVILEDHQVTGGLGSAVAEYLSENHPTHIEFVGVKDKFGQSGRPEELFKYYGLDEESIEESIKKVLTKK